MCRVYVISGSFRSFDRRPLKNERVESRLVHDEAGTSLLGGLHGGAGVAEAASAVGGSSSTNWNVNNDDNEVHLQEPVWEWEWEQFNWI